MKQNSLGTDQEEFWIGRFGDEYIDRNRLDVSSNISLFSKILSRTAGVSSVLELGCNIGSNLDAISSLIPGCECHGVEINKSAAAEAASKGHHVTSDSILNFDVVRKYDLVFTKGVLIHINPDFLNIAYEKIVSSSSKYICVCEYYNPVPASIDYRGHKDKLFKRDFAGELMDAHDLKLLDYGFAYHRDNNFRQDDITYFLLSKKQ